MFRRVMSWSILKIGEKSFAFFFEKNIPSPTITKTTGLYGSKDRFSFRIGIFVVAS